MQFGLRLFVLPVFADAQLVNTIYHAGGGQSAAAPSADGTADGWPDNPFTALGEGEPGVGEQWVNHAIETAEIPMIHIPVIGDQPFDLGNRLLRAFMGISAFRFDYHDVTFLFGDRLNSPTHLRPTERYNYRNSENIVQNDSVHDDPASGTIDGVSVSRARINVILWAVYAKAFYVAAKNRGYGYPTYPPTEVGEDLAIWAGGWLNGALRGQLDESAPGSIGIQLYYAIKEGKSDAWIKDNVLTVNAARQVQTQNDPEIWDEELWPRPDYVAPSNNFAWRNGPDSISSGLNDYKTFIRPDIFLRFHEMDYVPWDVPF